MNQLTLTRYLYFADEVSLSLLDCLIEQRDLNEALFWTDELYASGFKKELWLLLWKIYFDFYALVNEQFIKKFIKMWKKPQTIENVSYIVKNLFHLKTSYHVFLFRIKKYKKPLTVYLPEKLTKKERIIQAIKSRHIANLRYLLDHYEFNQYQDINFLLEYFEKNENAKPFKLFDFPEELIENFTYYYILSHMDLSLDEKKKGKQIRRKLTEKDKIISEILGNDDTVGCERYKVLLNKKIYAISKHIGCFEKARDNVIIFNKRMIDLETVYLYYWIYFTKSTPLWCDRIKKYDGEYNIEKFDVTFKNDLNYEEFYEKYNLEPDEQSQECHNKTILEIPEKNIREWLQLRFNVDIDTRCEVVYY
jgi:hypothetical protein